MMRNLLITVVLATSFAASLAFAGTAPQKGPVVPRKSGEFVIQNPDGPEMLLSSYRGKTVVLALMYTTCPHCQHTASLLVDVQKEYAAKGVQVLGATFDQGAATRVKEFSRQLGLNFPVGLSTQGSVLEFLQLPVNDPYFVPILVFIDKTGMVRSQYVGDETFLNKQEKNIRAEIDKMLNAPAAVKSAKK